MNVLATIVVSLVTLVCCARVAFGDGSFYCDGLNCPKNTYTCDVTARNDPVDVKQVVRERKCLSEDGKVLQREVVKEPNSSGGTVNSHAFSFSSGGGHELTSEEARQLFGPPYISSGFGGNWPLGNVHPLTEI